MPPSQEETDPQPDRQSEQATVQIELTSQFQQDLRDLAKRYRNIRFDLQAVIQELEFGKFIGDRLAETGKGYVVFKARVKNRDIQKGKSAGYRLIYQVESPTSVLLLTVYSKSDRADISSKEIRKLLGEFYEND